MIGKQIQILDTGRATREGSVIYTQASENWLTLFGTRMNFGYRSSKTDNVALRASNGVLQANPNELTSINPVSIQIWGHIPSSESEVVAAISKLNRTAGVKYLKGGNAMLEGCPDAIEYESETVLPVIIYGLDMTESTANGVDYINITINAEVV